jgi:hypothetical protein
MQGFHGAPSLSKNHLTGRFGYVLRDDRAILALVAALLLPKELTGHRFFSFVTIVPGSFLDLRKNTQRKAKALRMQRGLRQLLRNITAFRRFNVAGNGSTEK